MHNPFKLLEYNARIYPDKPAMNDGAEIMSFLQIYMLSRQIAAGLGKLGIKPGQLVATCLPQNMDWIFTFALFHEACISCTNQGHSKLNPDLKVDWIITNRKVGWFPEDRQLIIDQAWINALANEAPAETCKDYGDGDAVCRLILTSGTTGYAKAAVFTVEMLLYRMARLRAGEAISPTFALSVLPISTALGFFIAMNSLYAAEPCFFGETQDDIIALLETGQVRYLVASPIQLSGMLKRIEKKPDFQHAVKTILTGGSYLSPVLYDKIMAAFGADFYCAYGSTEAGRTCINPLRNHENLNYTGLVVYDAVIEILDDAGNALPAGKDGVIRIKCPYGVRQYYNDPEGTEKALKDGWFYPGDRGHLTKQDVLVLSGRVDDLINRGGVKIDPGPLDRYLQHYTGIKDAAVVGLQNEEGLQELTAALVAADDFDIEALKADILKTFGRAAVPENFFTVNEIPRNDFGKILRSDIRQELLARNVSTDKTGTG